MAVKIRLKRIGAKKQPSYRIVVADARSPRDGKFIEELGFYNPLAQPADIRLDVEKAEQWMKNGAQPTDTVRALINKCKAEKPEEKAKEEILTPAAEDTAENKAEKGE